MWNVGGRGGGDGRVIETGYDQESTSHRCSRSVKGVRLEGGVMGDWMQGLVWGLVGWASDGG